MKQSRRILQHPAVMTALCWLGAQYMRLVYGTSRWQVVRGEIVRAYWDKREPFIGCFWHGRLMMMAFAWDTDVPVSVVISRHADGRAISQTVAYLGIGTISGSSSKGGIGAGRGVFKALEQGACVCITPDGPRGPRMRASLGAVTAAGRAGVPIICGAYSISRRRVLNSWDRFVVPLPFSRGVFTVGEPIHVPADADADVLEAKRRELEARLNEITREADELCGWPEMAPGPEPALAAAAGSAR